ncbi:MAG: formylmethanofuran dehydrogenase subunit E family protein [Firmicutes bacterium]|nr:formylmethanofuran dehydrogenase subunit E family protein [Bacillota bacterium]
MDRERILRLVGDGEVDHIGARVEVEFDNRQQVPLGFRHGGRHYEVVEVVRTEKPSPLQYHYLVRTTGGVYNLVLVRQDAAPGISPSVWWLDFRVRDGRVVAGPGDRAAGRGAEAGPLGPGMALVRGELLGVVAFHGHLCPELALGYRASMLARARLGFDRHQQGAQTVVMYSSSSAADAVQYLTGCTLGKGNLVVNDAGDHVFCFTNRRGKLLLKVLPGVLEKCSELKRIEEEIEQGHPVSPQDLAWYQEEIDRLVRRILESPDDALFAQVLLAT